MATYTSNYALHQWEEDDDFLRSDFNEDFAKIDTALGIQKSEYQVGIVNNAYNIYNMMLQNYYEDKYTGFKRALFFDGLSEEDDTRTLTDEVIMLNGDLYFCREGEQSKTWTSTSTNSTYNNVLYTNTVTVEALGMLTGYTFSVYSTTGTGQHLVNCYINGTIVDSGYFYAADKVGSEIPYTLSSPILVGPGDTIRFSVKVETTIVHLYGDSGSSLAGCMEITPIGGETGSLSTTLALGTDWTSCHLWVRYSGGGFAPTVNDVAMTLSETVQTQTLDGVDCTEDHWIGGSDSDTADFVLNLVPGEDNLITIHDYGMVFL